MTRGGLIRVAVLLVIGGPLSLLISYGFALLGEPTSVWLFRDILGLL
jgi:hypothetical protein